MIADADALRQARDRAERFVHPRAVDEYRALMADDEDTLRRVLDRADAGITEFEPLGPGTYRAVIGGRGVLGPQLVITISDVKTGRDLEAYVRVEHNGSRVFTTGIALGLTGRDKIADKAADWMGVLDKDDRAALRKAVSAVVEAVLDAEERAGGDTDLRHASLSLPGGGLHVADPLWPTGSTVLVAPGAAGKSTIARALAVSVATGWQVIPGVEPIGEPRPVLYVAAEDPAQHWHARSVAAICAGVGRERDSMPHPVHLIATEGRALPRIARSLAQRAAASGAVIILDSQQALLAGMESHGGVRDRDSDFWHAVDQLGVPVLVIAHPNRNDSRNWDSADGRVAGTEVNRDRARMAWAARIANEPALPGTSYRRYTLSNTKNNHGPVQPPLAFGVEWTFGTADDPGVCLFTTTAPLDLPAAADGPQPSVADTLAAIQAGVPTDSPKALQAYAAERGEELTYGAAKVRLARARKAMEERANE